MGHVTAVARQQRRASAVFNMLIGVLVGFLTATVILRQSSLLRPALERSYGMEATNNTELTERSTSSRANVREAVNRVIPHRHGALNKAETPQGERDRDAGRTVGKVNRKYKPASLASSPVIVSDEEVIGRLLGKMDVVFRNFATKTEVHDSINTYAPMEQPLSYLKALREYRGPAKRICEIGFAGGHSATIFLHALPDAEYQAFDMWNRPLYEDAALAQLKVLFPNRQFSVSKGDSTHTVPRYQGTCDIIHINGAHHAHFPAMDLANMERLANPDGHILFLDDCTTSFPAVLSAWDRMKAEGRVAEHAVGVPQGWSFNGKQRGWCIGEYVRRGSEQLEQPSDTAAEPAEGANFRTFLGQKFCNVGWAGSDCAQRIHSPPCGPHDDSCFNHPDYGIAAVSHERWLRAQTMLQRTWETRDTDVDRNDAHKASFDGYSSLPRNLGDTLEVACGPYTQVKTILGSGHEVGSLTLLDPSAFHYMTRIQRSSYRSGLLQALGVDTTTVMSVTAEEMTHLTGWFDTVVIINGIEHMQDSFKALENIYRMLRPGGLLVWHSRLWDANTNTSGKRRRDIDLHPIRLTYAFADHFTKVFESVYESRDTAELRRLGSQGTYFIGRKKLEDGLPSAGVTPVAAMEDGLTVVLITHSGSLRGAHLMRVIQFYHAMPIIRRIVLILNGGAPQAFNLEPFASKVVLKYFVLNSMNNRFRISREVLTEAVMIVDDDIELKEALLQCLLDQWLLDKQRVIGTDPRSMGGGRYRMGASRSGRYTYVIGKTMLFHRRYLDAYLEDQELVDYVNPEGRLGAGEELNFCEDLGMVALVAKLTGKAPLAVNPGRRGGLHRVLADQGAALHLGSGWTRTRTQCSDWFEQHFNFTLPTENMRPVCRARPKETTA